MELQESPHGQVQDMDTTVSVPVSTRDDARGHLSWVEDKKEAGGRVEVLRDQSEAPVGSLQGHRWFGGQVICWCRCCVIRSKVGATSVCGS